MRAELDYNRGHSGEVEHGAAADERKPKLEHGFNGLNGSDGYDQIRGIFMIG